MGTIHILKKQVAELIAAGEVIERPSSVVKELLENAIDAGADTITLEIERGGKEKIKVTDNGSGIPKEDIQNAFYRHATSKIETQEDLDRIGTLGFRGEALSSIAAVSKVELITKHASQPHGTQYKIEGSQEILMQETGCANGSTFIIKDLFYNVPARKKFLKKDVTEGNAVASILEIIALSHPEISFRFIRDKKPVLQTPGTGDLFATIYAVFGGSFAKKMMQVSIENNDVTVKGYTSIPMQCRANRTMQYFFVNGRYVKSNACTTALEEGYKGSVMVGKFPACVLFINLPLHMLDINVHPAKIEVRFADENQVMRSVYLAVKGGIAQYSRLVSNADSEEALQEPEIPKARVENRETYQQLDSFESLLKDGGAGAIRGLGREAGDVSDFVYLSADSFKKKDPKKEDLQTRIIPEEPKAQTSEDGEYKETAKEEEREKKKRVRIIGELFQTYILAEMQDQFILLDKHAAHERILYNQLKKDESSLQRQLLITPLTLTLSKIEWDAVENHRDVFQKLGFSMEAFGENELVIREVPAILQKEDGRDVFLQIVNNLIKQKQDVTPESLENLLHTIACKAAIKAHDDNSLLELQKLFDAVYYDENVRYCPHGRPVILVYTRQKLERQFGR